jgi:SAM-dependent methyltransferase
MELKILDFCCGHGRHLIPLYNLGFDIKGLDINNDFLEYIRQKQNGVDLINEDGRYYEATERYNVIINLETSIGYLSESEDRRMIRNIYNNLENNGLFLIHVFNREYLIKHFESELSYKDKYGDLVKEERIFDPISSTLNLKQYRNNNADGNQYEIKLRLYTAYELINILKDTGFIIREIFGGFSGEEYSLDSSDLIILSEKLK